MGRLDKMYYGTNTKMFKTPSEAAQHIGRFAELTDDLRDEIVRFIIPSYTSLPSAVETAEGTGIMIGAQNVGWEERGQFTGEISVLMLDELGVDMVMIGHSERRHVLHETDFEEEKKVICSAEHGFTTLLCIGETAEQKEYGLSRETLATQLKIGLHSLPAELAAEKLWVAYEPVWAIGVNGVPADPAYANEMHRAIKDVLCEIYGSEIGEDIPVLYGGSVNNENCVPLIKQQYIDGLFTGRSAWDADNFNKIVRMTLPVFNEKKQKYR